QNRVFGTRIRSFQTCGGRGSGRCAPQIEKRFEIPGDRDQGPFTGSRVQSTQVELTKTQRGFDNPVYGFYHAFAQRVDGASTVAKRWSIASTTFASGANAGGSVKRASTGG